MVNSKTCVTLKDTYMITKNHVLDTSTSDKTKKR